MSNSLETETNFEDGTLKDITNVIKNASISEEDGNSTFKVCSNSLPEKTSAWTKVKNAMLYEISVELTPYEQKIEDEINDFLHQDVTWSKFRDFLLKEVPITYKGKRVF